VAKATEESFMTSTIKTTYEENEKLAQNFTNDAA
jgi:hypothetical protein